ncbi:hypothetical protein [Rhodopirellula bahusiensis]|uniref:hypothetical protein n=1 Tax=Rhodopirellula bahusiensis TaxID=2014065 RepID=UPI003264D94E
MRPLAEILAEINDHIIVEGHIRPTVGSDPIAAADAATLHAGHRPIGNRWRELSESPLELLTHHIGHDLAYGPGNSFAADKCVSLAESLLCHADTESRWFTNNSEFEAGPSGHLSSYSGTPITDWTFDAAVIAVGPQNTLFLCFKAED